MLKFMKDINDIKSCFINTLENFYKIVQLNKVDVLNVQRCKTCVYLKTFIYSLSL